MADIHQSDQYGKLVRRIGYSVGLEDLIDRVDKLVSLYVVERDINIADWKNLVKEKYGRKISDDLETAKWGGSKRTSKKLGAENHFADFYSELNLLSLQNNRVFPLYGLEILSILKRTYKNSDNYYKALQSVILLFILEADGDIFLNCLYSNFEKKETIQKVLEMFQEKKRVYFNIYLSPTLRNKLSSLFQVQTSIPRNSVFDRKTLPTESIEIPEDYISKILPTRKGWAVQLGLFSASNQIDQSADNLLDALKEMHIYKDSFFAFFAYSSLHKTLFVDESKAGISPIQRKDFIKKILFSYLNNNSNIESRKKISRSIIYEILFDIMNLYKSGNKVKGIIRHQLPLQVLFPVYYIISALNNYEYIDLDTFINEEQKLADRKIDILNLRGAELEGALSFRT